MRTFEMFIAGALVLIGLYLLFNARNVGSVVTSLAQATGGLFGVLQGRNVNLSQGGFSVSG